MKALISFSNPATLHQQMVQSASDFQPLKAFRQRIRNRKRRRRLWWNKLSTGQEDQSEDPY